MRTKIFLIITAALTLAVFSAPAQAPSSSLVGAAACARCHQSAYRSWQASAHARANASLPAENRSDSRCLRCHGSAEEGTGGVQCESCHGPGKIYARRHVMKDRELSRLVGLQPASLENCARCHTETSPRLQKFLPEKAWLLVKHGREAAQGS
jgi:hypothetical protein